MKPFGKLFLGMILFAFMIFYAGCTSESSLSALQPKSGEKAKVIGLSLYYRQDEYYRDTEAAFVDEAKTRGYEIIVEDANADLYRQVQQLEDFISKKVDLILMSAVEPDKIIPTVKQINKANISIIAYDEPPKGGDILSCIVWDNFEAGRMIGEWAENYIEKNLGGKADIAILDLPSQSLCMERVRGFRSVVEKMSDVKIVYEEDYKADRSYAMSLTENIIESYDNVNMILGVTDDAAFGAVAAIEASKKDLVVLCAGSWSVEAMKALAYSNRYYKANVTVNPYEQAKAVFDTIDSYFRGENVNSKYYMKIGVYDKDNINSLNWKAIETKRNGEWE